jgi:hypothetical protein
MKLRFSGRIHASRLAPGTYTLSATPALGHLSGRAVSARFSIRR